MTIDENFKTMYDRISSLENLCEILKIEVDSIKSHRKNSKIIYKNIGSRHKKYRNDTIAADILRAIGDYMVLTKPPANPFWRIPRGAVFACYKSRFGKKLGPKTLASVVQSFGTARKMVAVSKDENNKLTIYENGTARICDLLGLDFDYYFKAAPVAAPDDIVI